MLELYESQNLKMKDLIDTVGLINRLQQEIS